MSADEVPGLMIGDPEVRGAVAVNTRTKEQVTLVDRFSRFFFWSLATRAVAHLQRQLRKDKSHSLTTVTEQETEEQSIIKPAIIPRDHHITKMVIAHCNDRMKPR